MKLRQLLCGLRGHRYRYAGILLGQRLEQRESCDKARTL
jgi:hypothetical protein